jgi:hypothetical protein
MTQPKLSEQDEKDLNWALSTLLDFARNWAEGKRRDREVFNECIETLERLQTITPQERL